LRYPKNDIISDIITQTCTSKFSLPLITFAYIVRTVNTYNH